MKKKILIVIAVIFAILFVVYNMGFQIGNFKIGKQTDNVQTAQKYDLVNSEFSKAFLQEGDVAVINLWASWCKPCIEELPTFKNLQKSFPSTKFAMLSIDMNEEDLTKGIDKFKVTNDVTLQNRQYRMAIRNFLENRDYSSIISTEVVPVTYFVKNGKVVKKIEGSIEYDEAKNIIESLSK